MKLDILCLGNKSYADWLGNINHVNNVEHADLVIFTGGDDVTPSFYNETQYFNTYNNKYRDEIEKDIFIQAMASNIPCLGICRGSQFLTAMNGGKVIQDVTNHTENHNVKDLIGYTDLPLWSTSTHHQMSYPFNLKKDNYIILAESWNKRSNKYIKNVEENYLAKDVPCEPEVIFYPLSNCLGIQGHPEMMHEDDDFVIYCKYLVKTFLITDQWKDLNLI